MPKIPGVKLLKQIKINGNWTRVPALYDSKGRVRRDHVRVNGADEVHAEGSYFIEFWDQGKRHREAAGPDAFVAADKARIRQAELSAMRHGLSRRMSRPHRNRSAPPSPTPSRITPSTFNTTAHCGPSAPIAQFLRRFEICAHGPI